jgi:hypothetical protein
MTGRTRARAFAWSWLVAVRLFPVAPDMWRSRPLPKFMVGPNAINGRQRRLSMIVGELRWSPVPKAEGSPLRNMLEN